MSGALVYTPRPGPFARAGALSVCAYLGVFVAIAFAFTNPLVLAGDAAAVAVLGLAAGAGAALRASLRFALVLGFLMVAANAVASQRGDTILVRGPELPLLGPVDISAEALAEGGVLALRVAVVIAAFAVLCAVVDPDRVLRLLRPLARRSALTSTLIVRLVPLAARDHARLAEGAQLRGPAAAPVGRGQMARRLVAGSLDRAVDVAATLELRGFGAGAPGAGGDRPGASAADAAFWLAAIAVAAVAGAVILAGGAGYESYPLIALDAGPPVLILAAALPILALLPFTPRGRR